MLGQSSTEASGLLQAAPAPIFTTEPVLVLAPHAQLGRRISISFSLVFLFGFHGALLVTALLNWRAPCDRPLHVFLVAFSLVGLVASAVYFVLEVALKREPSGLPGAGEAEPAWQPKMLVTGLLVAALASGAFGAVSLASSPACHLTAPILYKWSLAAVVAFGIFCSLVVAVPLLAVVMPAAAVCLGPLIMALAACAEWMHTAGQRGPFGTVTSLQRLLGLGIDPESRPPMAPTSNFALFVNTCAGQFGAILRNFAQFCAIILTRYPPPQASRSSRARSPCTRSASSARRAPSRSASPTCPASAPSTRRSSASTSGWRSRTRSEGECLPPPSYLRDYTATSSTFSTSFSTTSGSSSTKRDAPRRCGRCVT